jgi:hypothetical protein
VLLCKYSKTREWSAVFTLAVGIASYFSSVTREYKGFLGAFAELQKSTITSFMLVCLSAQNSVFTGRIFMKFDIWVFFENPSRQFKFH